ncbi:hypothetical protein BBAD15_g9841 [Beauveria bassiana D1-5]|uniref:Protein kinase domain-containing protein n=1 Tax=Beauveria bassiana D1-5 TaxID=1245745 RepID=A0A0A2VFI4_BEABA|nr:hypothetical protein BBAD15_g9841 [Beauveria bassiana D1-5]
MAHELDDIRVVHINAGDEEGADITLDYNARRITISFFASSLPNKDEPLHNSPIENRIIGLLSQAVIAADEDYDDVINEALDVLLLVGRSSFSQAAPPMRQPHSTAQDLQSMLYPESLNFRLQTINGKAQIFQIRADEGVALPDTPPEPRLDTIFQPDHQLSCYSSEDILVQYIFVSGSGIVVRVHVDGRDLLCKASRAGLWDSGLEQELVALQSIQGAIARTGVTIRAPCLYAYVIHAHSKAIIGLLRQWVPSSSRGKTLRDINMAAVPLNNRLKWADQVRQTVANLHSIGVIWGDGKPSNIIVNENDDIELIDFAGGWSPGWVDKPLAETVEGDDQAVGRIVRFLGVPA